MLIDSDDPALQISRAILYPTLGLTVVLSVGIVVLATRTRNLKKLGGMDGMIGETGLVKETLNPAGRVRSEEHTSELQSRTNLVCRLLLEKKKKKNTPTIYTSHIIS